MKTLLISIWTFLLIADSDSTTKQPIIPNLNTQPKINVQIDTIYPTPEFSIDSAKWITKNKVEVIKFFNKNSNKKTKFSTDQIIGLFTLTQTPVVSYPHIFILDNTMESEPPSMDQLARELNAVQADIESIFSKDKEINHKFKEAKLEQPILIPEKKLILLEVNASAKAGVEIKIRQAMFFDKRRLISIQFAYIKGRDEEHINDFNKLVETFQM